VSLDPKDWGEFRALAHEMVDGMVDHLSTLDEQPAWQPVPGEVSLRLLEEPIPWEPQGDRAAYEAFVGDVLPYPNGNLHPRFFGWVQGNGIPLAMMADMLASGMNPHLAGFNHAPVLVEQKLIAWLAELMGFPAGTSGVLESGGTMGNVLGLTVARHAKAGFDVHRLGLRGGEQPLVVYCSTETHGWIEKGVELLGLGTDCLRKIPVDSSFRMDLGVLREQIFEDVDQGLRPICVIGTAGTVNTGAIDDLAGIRRVCDEFGLWFHVDGAFGALACLSPVLREKVSGIHLADSVAFDLHKWMYLPFEIACVLVKDEAAHLATFAHAPSYLATLSRGPAAGGMVFADRGFDLTRGFKALKAWMCLKAFGVNAFAAQIEENVRQAEYLDSLVSASSELELVASVSLNVVCLRYVGGLRDFEALNRVNTEILLRVQEQGIAVPSSTVIDGKFTIRVCLVNHRTQLSDIECVVGRIIEIGRQVEAQG